MKQKPMKGKPLTSTQSQRADAPILPELPVPFELLPYPRQADSTVTDGVWLWPQVPSPQLGNRRDVIVYLPPSYAHTARRYPVLYMQDGQNLFDRATSFAGAEWEVDESMDRLAAGEESWSPTLARHASAAGPAAAPLEAIVIGLNHGEVARATEYTPFATGQNRGADYVRFLIETVKPAVDATLRTQPGPATTAIVGSSMGGLISLFAFFHRPDVFGRAAVMSPSLWVNHFAIYDFVRQAPVNPGKLYLDHGDREGSAKPMVALLQERGYQLDRTLHYIYEPGGGHNEASWARRFPDAVRFLLAD